jgi:hypothetical protein
MPPTIGPTLDALRGDATASGKELLLVVGEELVDEEEAVVGETGSAISMALIRT